MTLGALTLVAQQLAKVGKAAYDESWNAGNGNVRRQLENRVKNESADVQTALELLDQVRWRKPRKGSVGGSR